MNEAPLRRALLLSLLFALLSLTACFPSFEHGLPRHGKGRIDGRLLGTWRSADPAKKEEGALIIRRGRRGWLTVVRAVSTKERDDSIRKGKVIEAYSSRIGRHRFLNCRKMSRESDDSQLYIIMAYEVDGDDLKFFPLAAEKLGALVKTGRLKGDGAGVRIQSSGRELARVFREEGVTALFDCDDAEPTELRLQRSPR